MRTKTYCYALNTLILLEIGIRYLQTNITTFFFHSSDKKPVSLIKRYKGGFHGRVIFIIDYDVSDWEVWLYFVRGVWKLEVRECQD